MSNKKIYLSLAIVSLIAELITAIILFRYNSTSMVPLILFWVTFPIAFIILILMAWREEPLKTEIVPPTPKEKKLRPLIIIYWAIVAVIIMVVVLNSENPAEKDGPNLGIDLGIFYGYYDYVFWVILSASIVYLALLRLSKRWILKKTNKDDHNETNS